MFTELKNVTRDISTGALPMREIPAFIAHIATPVGLVCAIVAVVGTVALIVTR